jgi:hypothetical protein
MAPNSWQKTVLSLNWRYANIHMPKRSGKTVCAAMLAVQEAEKTPKTTVVVCGATDQHTDELVALLDSPHITNRFRSAVWFDNDSRVVGLATDRGSRYFRSYEADIVIIDTASQTPQEFFDMMKPWLATRKGRLICFYDEDETARTSGFSLVPNRLLEALPEPTVVDAKS